MRALLKEILENPVAMVLAILVHVVLAAVLFVSLEWNDVPTPAQPTVNIVKAVAVDEAQILAEVEKLKKAEKKKANKDKAKQRKLDKKARDAKKKRQREEKRLAKLRKERDAEKKRQKKLQKERKIEEKRIAADRAEKKKELEHLEQKRITEEKRLADAAAQRKKLDDKRRRDAEAAARRAEMVAEQQRLEAANQKRLSSLRGRYIADIQNAVERRWIRPASAKQGLKCKVAVNQIPGGEVINVTVTQCIGDDIFRRSVETAVHKASPLPRPSDPGLFDREIVFTFKPKK